jgi:cytochrome bd-type quinol oxidase subunit 1
MSLLVTLCIALGFVIYCTVLYVRDLKTGKNSWLKKTLRWIKNVIDVLFGIG